jgi:hypothetical protein
MFIDPLELVEAPASGVCLRRPPENICDQPLPQEIENGGFEMANEKVTYKVELINLAEVAKLPRSFLMHRMRMLEIKPAKLTGEKAAELLKKKPGGSDVVGELVKLGKIKDITKFLPASIGYSDPTSGDPWYARNAEIHGPPVTRITFCCVDGPNGYWESRFNMLALDDMMAMVHVSNGNGTVSAWLDGVALGVYPFSGDDWIVVTVGNLAAGWHTFRIEQESGYFTWLSTEYFRL